MININKYSTLESYLADQNITYDECRVSQIGDSDDLHIMYDLPNGQAINRVLTSTRLGKDDVCIVVKDKLSNEIKYIPEDTFRPDLLDTGVYEVKDYVRYHGEGKKQYYLYKNNATAVPTSQSTGTTQWAIPNFYKLTFNGYSGGTVPTAGSFTWSVTVNGTARSATCSWSAGASLDTIVSNFKTAEGGTFVTDQYQNGGGFYIAHLTGEDFIRISIGNYSNSTLTLSDVSTNSGAVDATLEDLSLKLRYDGSVPADYTTETHHTWQAQYLTSMLPNSVTSLLRTAYGVPSNANIHTNECYCRYGENLGYYAGANYSKYYSYYNGTNGSTNTANAFKANAPLRKSVFDTWTEGLAEFGTYENYLIARMADPLSSSGVNTLSYDNGQAVTGILSKIETMDFNGSWISVFPAAAAAVQYSDTDLGTMGVPTAHEVILFMCDKRPDRFSAINRAIQKLGGTQLSNGTNYWSSVEYTGSNAWFYTDSAGALYRNTKYNVSTVRPGGVLIV